MPPVLSDPYHDLRASDKLKARRWRYEPFMLLIGKVSSICKNCEELEAYHECSPMCFMETWLKNNISDSGGFTQLHYSKSGQRSKRQTYRWAEWQSL